MDKKMLKALNGAITKWAVIVQGGRAMPCPLCILTGPFTCNGCPINEKTGECCKATPYVEFTHHLVVRHFHCDEDEIAIFCPECQRLAIKEFEFLLSLLPRGKKWEPTRKL